MLTIFVSFSFEGFAQTGPWTWMHPTPQGNTIRWVKYWDANNWYAVGLAGTFMKTSNAGTTWTYTHLAGGPNGFSGQRNSMYYAHFFNANTGMVFGAGTSSAPGANGIWRTTNAGLTWDSTNVTPFVTGIFYFASFVNSNLGYASCTSAPYVFRTTNAGLTWEGLATAGTAGYDIYASDSLNIILATTLGNIKKSTDGGATWATISTGTSATMYRMVFADANTGYIYGGATGATGFRYTTNAGLNWTTPANAGLPNTSTSYWDIDLKTASVSTNKLEEGFESTTFPPVGWKTVDVLDPLVVWTRSTSYYHSGVASAKIGYGAASGGEDWLISPKVNGIAVGDSVTFWWRNAFSSPYFPDTVLIKVSTTDTALTSFTNTIGSFSGALTPNVFIRYSFPLGAFAGQNVYVAFQHKDADGNGGYLDDIAIGPQTPPILSSNVYITGNSFYVRKTTNMGVTWDSLEFLAPVSSQPWTGTYYSLDVIPGSSTDDFIIGGAFGLFNRRAGTTNTTFTKLAKPGTHVDVWAASSTGTVIAVGAPTVTGSVYDQIIRSTDGGTTWSIVPFSTTSRTTFNCIQMIDNNTGYASGTLSALYRTTNGGVNWDSVAIDALASGTHSFRKVEFINANTGWVFGTFISTQTDSATVYKTTNAGVNWTKQYVPQYPGSSSGLSRGVYGADMLNATTGWLVSYQPRPYRTTDGGTTWTLDSISDGFGGFMYDVKMFSATNGIIAGSSGRIYKLNASNIWDTVSVPTRSYSFNGLDFISPSAGYAVGSTGIVIATTNGGTTWTQTNTFGSTNNNVYITPDTKAFIVGSNGYIHKNNNILTGVAGNENSLLPTKYTLEQNYPNPFNPTTTIKFSLPKAGIVTMKIYDVAGREVMRLINNQNMSAGYQTQLFNGSMLSSGVYFYSLIVDNNLIATKKMVLVK